jgi:hypothetical protein
MILDLIFPNRHYPAPKGAGLVSYGGNSRVKYREIVQIFDNDGYVFSKDIQFFNENPDYLYLGLYIQENDIVIHRYELKAPAP